MAENNMNEQMQGELTDEELSEVVGGRRVYNSKYQVFVDPEKKEAYQILRSSAWHRGSIMKIPFKPEYLEGLKY